MVSEGSGSETITLTIMEAEGEALPLSVTQQLLIIKIIIECHYFLYDIKRRDEKVAHPV